MSEIKTFDENGKCNFCEWRPEYMDCHVQYSLCYETLSRCEYIKNKYVLILDQENGEIDWYEKPLCRVCNVLLPLKKNNQINRKNCCGFEGDYYHKKCFNNEKIIMNK